MCLKISDAELAQGTQVLATQREFPFSTVFAPSSNRLRGPAVNFPCNLECNDGIGSEERYAASENGPQGLGMAPDAAAVGPYN